MTDPGSRRKRALVVWFSLRFSRLPLLVVVLACCAAPIVQAAEAGSTRLREGLDAYDRLEYERAVEALEQARAGTLDDDERALALRTLGFAYVALSQDAPARVVFEALLRLRPDTRFDRSVSPRVRAVWEAVRLQMGLVAAAAAPVSTLPTPPPTKRPVYKRGWFWGVIGGIAGAAIVGGVIGGVLASRPGTIAAGGLP